MQEDKNSTPSTRENKAISEILKESIKRALEAPSPDAIATSSLFKTLLVARQPTEIWIVIGKDSDYIVIPNTYCSCPHFQIKIVYRLADEPCYHLVAVELSKKEDRYYDLTNQIDEETLYNILYEALAVGRSSSLRRILYEDIEP